VKEIDGKSAREVLIDKLSGGDPQLQKLFSTTPTVGVFEAKITFATQDPKGDFYWGRYPEGFRGEAVLDPYAHAGKDVVIVKTDHQSLMEAVTEASQALATELGTNEPELVLAFSCGGRGYMLGNTESAKEEGVLRKTLHPQKFLGVETCGEIGCWKGGPPQATAWVYSLTGVKGR
jgi:hypothetical protein